MAEIINGEFDLNGFRFGTDRSGYPLVPGGFSVGTPEFRIEDEDNPLGDGVFFGEDLLSGLTYTWEMLTYHDGPDRWANAAESLNAFRKAWHGRRLTRAKRPNQMESLRLYYGGQVGRIYGRPRRFHGDRTRLRKGIAYITCDFRAVDDLVYSDQEFSATIPILTSSGGGLQAPLEAPLTSEGVPTSRQGYITVGGDAPVYPRIRINGPIINPFLRLTEGWRLSLTTTLASDQWIDIDPQPWDATVLLNGRTSVAGRLDATSPAMANMRLHPGDHEFEFGGVDNTGLATAQVWWRTARYAL